MRRYLPIVLLFATGCFRTSPPVVFHTLVPLAQAERSKAAPSHFALEVMPVRLPELLQRPQLVARGGSDTLALLEHQRWGNALDKDMQRVMTDNLSVLLDSDSVVSSPHGERVKARYRVTLDVHRCDGQPGGMLQFRCTWMVTRWEDGQAVLVRNVSFQESIQGRDPAALVGAHSRVLENLSRAMASELRSLKWD